MQLEEPGALEAVGDDGDVGGVVGGVFVEAEDGEEEVLEGVEGVPFGGYAWEEVVGDEA